MSVLDWDSRKAYVLTEFITFAIGATVLLAVATFIAVVVCYYYRQEKTGKLKPVLSLHRSLLRTVFWDTIKLENSSKGNGPTVTFSGLQPQSNLGKIVMVYVYFSLLCGLAALCFLAVFSDSLFYRKVSTCNDVSVRDTDLACFKISTTNVPPEVQRIIDEEGEGLVPCRKVQNYITQSNVTFDLEVLCYLSQLSPITALGVAYGATKSVIFAVVVLFDIGLALATKGKCAKRFLVVAQVLIVTVVILTILIVPASLHQASGPRNSAFDYLRGERFFSFAVIVLGGITTIITVGLHPWWAFDYATNVAVVPEGKVVA